MKDINKRKDWSNKKLNFIIIVIFLFNIIGSIILIMNNPEFKNLWINRK